MLIVITPLELIKKLTKTEIRDLLMVKPQYRRNRTRGKYTGDVLVSSKTCWFILNALNQSNFRDDLVAGVVTVAIN